MKKFIFIATPICMMFTNLATADTLPIDPGLWEFTSISTNPFTGQQESETDTECMVEDEYDPEKEMEIEDDMDCEVGESNLDGNTLTFSMSCNTQGGQMTMNAVYQSDGDSVQGTTVVEMSFGGQTMTSESSFTANRIGDC